LANRYFTQFYWTLEKNPVTLWARVTFGALGFPTLDFANSKGFKSITRSSAGRYVVTFGTNSTVQPVDIYNRLLFADACPVVASGNSASPDLTVVLDAVATLGQVTIQFDSGGVATDPAVGEAVLLKFDLKNSTAQ